MYARVRQLEMATQHRTESKVEEKEETEPLQKVATELFVHFRCLFRYDLSGLAVGALKDFSLRTHDLCCL